MIALSIILAGAILAAAYYHRSLTMTQATDRLTTSVNTLSSTVDSAVAALAGSDETVINGLADQVDTLNLKLSGAVNPPAAPAT